MEGQFSFGAFASYCLTTGIYLWLFLRTFGEVYAGQDPVLCKTSGCLVISVGKKRKKLNQKQL